MSRPRMARAAAAVCCGFALSGCLVQPTEPNCDGAEACSDCTGRSGCGWCASEEGKGSCLPGTSLGPDEADCEAHNWRFDGCEQPPGGGSGCSENGYCSTCTNDGCRWCVEEENCVPKDASCTPAAENPDRCSVAACRIHDECGSCLEAECTWCASESGTCIDSTEEECTSDLDRYHWTDSCPESACNGSTCDECTEDDGCVWCMEGDRGCRPADRTSGCDSWYDRPLVCP